MANVYWIGLAQPDGTERLVGHYVRNHDSAFTLRVGDRLNVDLDEHGESEAAECRVIRIRPPGEREEGVIVVRLLVEAEGSSLRSPNGRRGEYGRSSEDRENPHDRDA